MPKISEQEAARRRGAVIRAARACFARRGFEETSMDDICAEAGISKGALYGYFRSKDELIRAVAETQEGRLRAFEEIGSRAELFAMLSMLLGEYDAKGVAARLEINAVTRSFSDAGLRELFLANRAQMLRSMEIGIGRVAPGADAATIARLLGTFILGTAMQVALSPDAGCEADVLTLLDRLLPAE